MTREPPAAAPSSGYGRSCANCSKAKCRCVPRVNAEGCQRCHRLRRICTPARSIRYRPETPPPNQTQGEASSSTSSTASTAATITPFLEAKLDKLVTLLQEQHETKQPSTPCLSSDAPAAMIAEGPPLYYGTQPTTNAVPPSSYGNPLPSPGCSEAGLSSSTPLTSFPTAIRQDASGIAGSSRNAIFPCAGEPDAAEAEELFAIFKTHMLSYMPILHIPPDTTSAQFREARPFVWLCIMSVTCTSNVRQQTLGDSIRQIIRQDLFHTQDRGIDKLIGILIFLNWAYFQSHCSRNISELAPLAMSVVYELGLNRPKPRPRGPIDLKTAFASKLMRSRTLPPPRGIRTMQDRRAVLGCYILCSHIEHVWRRIDGLRWTPHMDETLLILSTSPECHEDELLAAHTQIQLIISQVNGDNCTWPFGNSLVDEPPQQPESHLRTLISQLTKLRDSLPPQVINNQVISLRFRTAKILLNEALLGCQPHSSYLVNVSRVEYASACLQEIKLFCDEYLMVPPANYVGIGVLHLLEGLYTLLVLSRFTATSDPAWDPAVVREVVDLADICEKWAQNYQVAAEIRRRGRRAEDDFYFEVAIIVRCIAKLWGGQRLAENPEHCATKDQNMPNPFATPEFCFDFNSTPLLMNMM